MRLAIFVLYFVAGMLALEGLTALFRRRADPVRVRNRLRTLARQVAQVELDGKTSMLRSRGELHLPILVGRYLPSIAGLQGLLCRAGGPLTAGRFAALSAALAICGFSISLLVTENPYRSVPGLLAGLLPWLFVHRAATKRMRTFEEQLPDALELIARCMRTGHALDAGFQMVGEELADPIGTEFGLMAEEIRMGLEIREVLANLMKRVDNNDLPYLTTAVLIQRQTGGNLAELLDKLGALLLERIQFNGRVRALTAQGRGAATFLALWLPFIIVVVWLVAPSYLMPLIENDWGHAVLASAIGLDVIAYYISLRIADVQA